MNIRLDPDQLQELGDIVAAKLFPLIRVFLMKEEEKKTLPARQGELGYESLAKWYHHVGGFKWPLAHALEKAGVFPATLITMTPSQMMSIDGIGPRGANAIMDRFGLSDE